MQQVQNMQNSINEQFIQFQNENELNNDYLLPPANSIIDKNKQGDSSQIKFKILQRNMQRDQNLLLDNMKNYKQNRKKRNNKQNTNQYQIHNLIKYLTLNNGYDQNNLIYKKYDNDKINILNQKKYFASIFVTSFKKKGIIKNQINKIKPENIKMPQIIGMIRQQQLIDKINNNGRQSLIHSLQDQLQFSSQFQSGNLFAVYKTGHFTYDLILQNDTNSIGFTQWFYFQVKNKKNVNFIAKFNIVNFYKSSSLYNKGMKPMTCSRSIYTNTNLKNKNDKINQSKENQLNLKWKRKGRNIFYQKNQIHHEYSKKLYYSLSFSYDFTKENDIVEFAHTTPYSYQRLVDFLSQIQNNSKNNSKMVIKILGVSPMKNNIPIIKFESQNKNSKIDKRSILMMARQHAGQVQGSWAIEQIIIELLKSSTEIDFLLWRFNIYIIPMINVDGVKLGNYRSNFQGYDLNRNWEKEENQKYPQVIYIKRQIKKIMVKYPIQLILDLHGHSKKMNSFFYGNPFRSNSFLYPYIASKINQFIKFQDSTFSNERKQKAKTARSVLGNLIRDTGNVYTFQMSFYGGIKNGKLINFYQEHYRELGRSLLSTMYKVYIEVYKQQKSSKQSLYLKQIRKQLSNFSDSLLSEQNSDSSIDSERQALQNQKKQEIKAAIQEIKIQSSEYLSQKPSKSQDLDQIVSKGIKYISQNNDINNHLMSQRGHKISIRSKQYSLFINDQSLQQKIKKHKLYVQKLKIFGENYLKKSEKTIGNIDNLNSNDNQLINNQEKRKSLIFEQKQKKQLNLNFSYLPNSKRSKNKYLKNLSTITPSLQSYGSDIYLSLQQLSFQDSSMNHMFHIKRLQYKKVQKNEEKSLKASQRSGKIIEKKQLINFINQNKHVRKNQNIFKLPAILGIDKTL